MPVYISLDREHGIYPFPDFHESFQSFKIQPLEYRIPPHDYSAQPCSPWNSMIKMLTLILADDLRGT